MEQAHADQPPVVMDALADVSVQLALADDGGREVNPAGVQLGTGDRLVAGPAQALQQQLLLGVSERALCDRGHWRGGVAAPRPATDPGGLGTRL